MLKMLEFSTVKKVHKILPRVSLVTKEKWECVKWVRLLTLKHILVKFSRINKALNDQRVQSEFVCTFKNS